jgi:RHS repeat-associated protein
LKRLNVCAAGRLLAVDEVKTDGSKVTSYLMADGKGSTRVLMNAAGAVTSRHDYFPFGEELGAGTGAPGSPTGMRTAAQGYSAVDNVRQRYADTRLDDATDLDHTLWRKLETRSGRWTTPDPYGGSVNVANPQSFNRYSYVHNDPVKFVDPRGLNLAYSGGDSGYCWFVSAMINETWQFGGAALTQAAEIQVHLEVAVRIPIRPLQLIVRNLLVWCKRSQIEQRVMRSF